MYHHENRYIKNLANLVETVAHKKIKKKLNITNLEKNEYFHILYGKFDRAIDKNTIDKLRNELAKKLKVKSDFIYLNEEKNGTVCIKVPNDIIIN